ncbi:hypothetical protein JSR02_00085 [Candidatus Vidania fulgoroideae]|uniref:Tyrosine--tRNA ligase n=1 Tax=Candidatus Vidania fulgoroideorum TaxID=881286 RepID=A0A974X7F4_9PROT|nr:hypothetical protein JSR02_00085 [Candidatus Vidania fulgoroideae]
MFGSLVKVFGVSFLGSLRSTTCVRIKYGVDPTAPCLHLGHFYCFFVIKFLLRCFNLCSFYFVIGDYTAALRSLSNGSNIASNIATITQTVQCFFNCSKFNFYVVRNSNWLPYLSMQFLHSCRVKDLLVRRALVGLNEFTVGVFLYPFYQSYDNFIVMPHIEVGGVDQLFNFCFYSSLPRFTDILFVMVPLVLGSEGIFKMSKSFSNIIAIAGCVFELFNHVIKLPEVYCAYYFFLFRKFIYINVGLVKTFMVFTCLYRLAIFVFIARFFYRSCAFKLLSLYFSRVYFPNMFFNFIVFSSVYLRSFMVTYCFFKSTRAFKKAISNHKVCINGIRICDFQFVLLRGAFYEILIGNSCRIYICF